MQTKNRFRWCALGLLIASCGAGSLRADTNQVYRLDLALTGLTQDNNAATFRAKTVRLTTPALINLVLGRALTAKPSPTEVLGLVLPPLSGTNLTIRMIVYDRGTGSNLATVATTALKGAVIRGLGGTLSNAWLTVTLAGDATPQPAGNSTNGQTGGSLQLLGTLSLSKLNLAKAGAGNLDGLPLDPTVKFQLHGTLTGVIETVIDSLDVELVIMQGALRAHGPPIGLLIEAP